MLTKHLAFALLGTALLAAPALAQTNPPAAALAPTASPNTAAPPMASGNWMTQEQPGQWQASKLEGVDVYNNADEKIGDISELIIDNSGKIQAVVVGVGGFLGIGERDVAIPFDQVKFVTEPRVNRTAVNTSNPGAAGTTGTGGTIASTAAPGSSVAIPANPNAPASSNMATNNAVANAPANPAANTAGGANTTGPVATANQTTMNRSAPDHALVNMTKDQVRAAPEFKYAR